MKLMQLGNAQKTQFQNSFNVAKKLNLKDHQYTHGKTLEWGKDIKKLNESKDDSRTDVIVGDRKV